MKLTTERPGTVRIFNKKKDLDPLIFSNYSKIFDARTTPILRRISTHKII